MQFRFRTLLIVSTIGPPMLAFFLWAWIRGGLSEALNLAATTMFFAVSLAAIHYSIKQNLDY
jgi:hypothetical protein